MIKEESISICKNYNVEFEVGSIKGNAIYQTFTGLTLDPSEEKYYCDIDLVDYTNIEFMGMAIGNDLTSFNKFKTHMMEMGINVSKIISKEVDSQITREYVLNDLKPILEVIFK